MSNFIKGQEVVQILPSAIEGKVSGFSLDEDTGEVLVLVSYTDADKNEQNRYFKKSELASI